MSLNFPSVEEIRLRRPPLSEVICQVKFAPILSIAKELPTDFQEAVRTRFPGFIAEQGVVFQLPASGGVDRPIVDAAPRIYRFTTADGMAFLSLATDSLALSTQKYSHWKDFLEDFSIAETALRKIYHPAYATRIGLRFINRFTRQNTGLNTSKEILELFRDELTCVLHTEAWQEPKEMLSQMVLVDNHAHLTLRIGYGKEQAEPFFLLDLDYFEEKQLPFDGLMGRIDNYHARIYAAFRWCMKEGSLVRFDPQRGG